MKMVKSLLLGSAAGVVAVAGAHALVDPIKERIKKRLQMFSPKRAGRTFRLFMRIRRMMRARAA